MQVSWGDLELNIKKYSLEFIIPEFSNLRIKDVGQVSNLEPCSGQRREITPLESFISS